MRDDTLNIDRFGCTPLESGSRATEGSNAGVGGGAISPANCTVQPLKIRYARTGAGRIIACLVGSLLLLMAMVVAPSASSAQISVFVSFGPPALPVYAQPYCPAPGYIWTPGYWAWDQDYGYYWVPGTWVLAPFVGAMWTPGYWAWNDGGYGWYPGYWGPVVGYYGGINYGYGYTGYGYYGGRWDHDRFYYNRSVNNIGNTYITNVYNQRVVENNRFTHVSYNGGPGGVNVRPTGAQLAAARERRFGPVNQQMQQERFARSNPEQRASVNRGRPAVAATPRPGVFRGNGIVRATQAGAPYREPVQRMGGREAARPAPTRTPGRMENERAPSGNAPRYSAPNVRTETRVPAQERPREPVRQNSPGTVQRNQPQARPPQAQRARSQAAPERNAGPSNTEKHPGGNGHKEDKPPR